MRRRLPRVRVPAALLMLAALSVATAPPATAGETCSPQLNMCIPV